MKHFKDNENKVWAFEDDGSQDYLIGEGLTAITDEEADVIRNPPLTIEQLQVQTNIDAREYLTSTDWYVVRFVETGVSIPVDVLEARVEARLSIV